MIVSRPTRRRHRRQAAGFSLIEVLVALGIFSLVGGLLAGALWSGQSQVARLERGRQAAEDHLVLRRVVGSWLQSATLPAWGGEDTTPSSALGFVGDERRMAFVTTLGGGLHRSTLVVEDVARGGTLLRAGRQRLDLSAAADAELPVMAVADVLASPQVLSFAYGVTSSEAGLVWKAAWGDVRRLPVYVQIRADGVPLLTVSIASSVAGACLQLRGLDGLHSGECSLR